MSNAVLPLDPGPGALSAAAIERQVDDDPVKPGVKGGALLKIPNPAICLDEGLLEYVLALVGVPQDPKRDAVGPLRKAPDEHLERLTAAFTRLLDQFAITRRVLYRLRSRSPLGRDPVPGAPITATSHAFDGRRAEGIRPARAEFLLRTHF